MLMTYVGWKLEINSCFSSAQSDWHWCYSYINHIRGWRTEHTSPAVWQRTWWTWTPSSCWSSLGAVRAGGCPPPGWGSSWTTTRATPPTPPSSRRWGRAGSTYTASCRGTPLTPRGTSPPSSTSWLTPATTTRRSSTCLVLNILPRYSAEETDFAKCSGERFLHEWHDKLVVQLQVRWVYS